MDRIGQITLTFFWQKYFPTFATGEDDCGLNNTSDFLPPTLEYF